MKNKVIIGVIILIVSVITVNFFTHQRLLFAALDVKQYFFGEAVAQGEFPRVEDYGMVPNDKSSAKQNGNILYQMIEKYGKANFSDTYYIEPVVRLKAETVHLKSTGEKKGKLIFDLDYSPALIDSGAVKNLIVENLIFENRGSEALILAYPRKEITGTINSVIYRNCEFYGNMSAYRANGDVSGNIENVGKITYFEFDNNIVSDTFRSFISIADMKYDELIVTNNKIKNFSYVFMNVSSPKAGDLKADLVSLQKEFLVSNNEVTSDLDWWGIEKEHTYYAFILATGNKIIYRDNYVYNLKSTFSKTLYDGYLSCNEVYYYNNVWENNLLLKDVKRNNTLLKSKGGSGDVIRVYHNNKFIFDGNFSNDPEKTLQKYKESFYVEFMSLETSARYYQISDNQFIGNVLKFPVASRTFQELVIVGNTIDVEEAYGSFSFVNNNENILKDKTKNENMMFVIKNNNIQVERYYDDVNEDKKVYVNLLSFVDKNDMQSTQVLELITYNDYLNMYKTMTVVDDFRNEWADELMEHNNDSAIKALEKPTNQFYLVVEDNILHAPFDLFFYNVSVVGLNNLTEVSSAVEIRETTSDVEMLSTITLVEEQGLLVEDPVIDKYGNLHFPKKFGLSFKYTYPRDNIQ